MSCLLCFRARDRFVTKSTQSIHFCLLNLGGLLTDARTTLRNIYLLCRLLFFPGDSLLEWPTKSKTNM
jgi:hypothetical protein